MARQQKPRHSHRVFSAPNFVTSAGTIILQREERRVVVLSDQKASRFFFPKGRMESGESLEATALREAFEETGYRASLIPIRPRHETHPRPLLMHVRSLQPGHPQRPLGQGPTEKVIYYFVGLWDGADRVLGTQLSYEHYLVHCLDFEEARRKMRGPERESLEAALHVFEQLYE